MTRSPNERTASARATQLGATLELTVASDLDVPSVVNLMNRAYRPSGSDQGWTSEADIIAGDRISEDLLRADLAANPGAVLLIWRHRATGILAGCVWLQPLGEGNWYLGSLTVDPREQKNGLGHEFLSRAEDWVSDRGGRQVRMTVVNVRNSLIAWYERRGYRRTGEIEAFPYGDNRFGTPRRNDLCFVVLHKDLNRPSAQQELDADQEQD